MATDSAHLGYQHQFGAKQQPAISLGLQANGRGKERTRLDDNPDRHEKFEETPGVGAGRPRFVVTVTRPPPNFVHSTLAVIRTRVASLADELSI